MLGIYVAKGLFSTKFTVQKYVKKPTTSGTFSLTFSIVAKKADLLDSTFWSVIETYSEPWQPLRWSFDFRDQSDHIFLAYANMKLLVIKTLRKINLPQMFEKHFIDHKI